MGMPWPVEVRVAEGDSRMDAELLVACQRGEREAFHSLFEMYQDRVYSFALRFLGDPSHAADLTQDIFVKLYARIRHFRGDSKFETWLYRVVANACIDDQRKRRRFLPWLADEHPSLVTGKNVTEEHVARKQAASEIQRAIAKLTPALRVPILLRYMEGLSYEEIGDVLQISLGTVASRLNRAHLKLAKKLERFRGVSA